MNAERFEQLLSDELDGELTSETRAELEAACRGDDALRRERERLVGAVALLRQKGPARAPADFAGDVMRRLRTEPSIEAEGDRAAIAGDKTERTNWWTALLAAPALRWGFGLAVVAIVAVQALVLTIGPDSTARRDAEIARGGPMPAESPMTLSPEAAEARDAGQPRPGEAAPPLDPERAVSELQALAADASRGQRGSIVVEAAPPGRTQPGAVATQEATVAVQAPAIPMVAQSPPGAAAPLASREPPLIRIEIAQTAAEVRGPAPDAAMRGGGGRGGARALGGQRGGISPATTSPAAVTRREVEMAILGSIEEPRGEIVETVPDPADPTTIRYSVRMKPTQMRACLEELETLGVHPKDPPGTAPPPPTPPTGVYSIERGRIEPTPSPPDEVGPDPDAPRRYEIVLRISR
jgi:hypothetical protein